MPQSQGPRNTLNKFHPCHLKCMGMLSPWIRWYFFGNFSVAFHRVLFTLSCSPKYVLTRPASVLMLARRYSHWPNDGIKAIIKSLFHQHLVNT